MSFFTTSTGENAAATATGEFSAGGGDFAPIPKDTRVLAMCDEAKISEYQGQSYINLKWSIAQPKEYKGRVIFQKIKCWEADSNKRDKSLRMLAAIDANAGGKLAASGAEPTDLSLQTSLTAKPMVLKLGVWDIDGKTGNWVQEVSKHQPKPGTAAPAPAPAPKPQPAPKPAPVAQSTGVDMDDDIPFAPMAHTRAMMLAM